MIRRPEPSAVPTAQRSVSRAIVAFIAVVFALTGVFTLPPEPTRAASTEWFGQKGSIVDGSGAGTAGTFLAAGSSVAGDAQFTYDIPVVGNNGESGTWSFFTTASANGTVPVPFHWTGLHAWFNVTARLDAVVVRGASLVSTTNLVNAGPESCCTTPSNGFDYSGAASFTVQTGDKYGFVLHGSNGDSNDFLRGDLTIGTVVPTSCANAQALYGSFGDTDGRYVIHPSGGQRFTVHCADMAIPAGGKDYLEVRSGPGVNYGQYATGGAATGTTVTTSYTKVRLDPANLTVDVNDTRFATSTGTLTHPDPPSNPTVTEMPYATAMGCAGSANGTANIDLQGTPFAVDDAFHTDDPIGGATLSQLDQVADLTGGGGCGWTQPAGGDFNPFNPDALPSNFSLDLRYVNATPVTVSTPVLFASIARSGSSADLYALVEGAESTSVTVQVRASASCTNGVLDSPTVVATSTTFEPTDADGYGLFKNVPGVSSGQFVTITVTSPASAITPAPSECIRTTGDNDAWPKALPLTFNSPATVQDVLEVDGRARWYRFPISPNQRITVSLSGLTADYELAVFRDIGAEFASQVVPTTADGLKRLSAKFSPSVFSPSVFSPSVFSPSVFSPDAYSPSVFSPSVFSPSVFSPSVFSPSVFSPSVFSPSVFSPSVFSPSVFSPSVFSPSVFSPSVFSPSVFSDADIAKAFSSAQSASIIGVSATPGNGDETVVVNSWNETGEFYVRVAGRGGAFDPSNLFTLTVTPAGSECTSVADTLLTPRTANADAGDFATVIVTDSSRLALGSGPGSLAQRIQDLRTRPEVDGVVVDLATDTRVQQLRTQADAATNRGCPFAQNLVAQEIKSIVDSYRATAADPDATETLRYVTILGGDTVVPFFRYPDQSLLGQESGYFPPAKSDSISEASLRRDYVLSQDAYGAGTTIDVRTTAFPIPDLAVGRLVETPSQITGMINAYISANGVVSPGTSLVTGYDFLTDAADAVSDEFDAGLTAPVDELITNADVSPQQLHQPGMTDPRTWSWNADDLRDSLLGERHDLVFLAGHFSANSALAADYQTQMITTELAGSSVNLVNSIFIGAGCHAGYNLVNDEALTGVALPLDWAEAFAQKGAVLVAGTGYQYGDTDFLEYSERLYRDFARELRSGSVGTAVPIGEALASAKRIYITGTADIRGIHEKAVLEATLFGLPMFGVNLPTGRIPTPGGGAGSIMPTPVAGGPAAQLGLATEDLSVQTPLTSPPPRVLDVIEATGVTGTVNATWLEGPDGVVTNPAEPALPKDIVDVTATSDDLVLRGVGFRGGTYTDTSNVLPLSGAPTTELRGVHAPFVSPVFYPMRMWTSNYFGEFDSGGTNLIVTPVQHRSDPAHAQRSIRRVFSDLDLRLFYADAPTLLDGTHGGAALADAPTIVDVDATADGSDIVFSAQVVGDPSAAIHEVWIVYTAGTGAWIPLDLKQCTAPLPASCAGLDDSRVWTGRLTNAPASVAYVAQAANGTGLVSFDDNRGQYYLGSTTPAPAAAATSLTLVAPVPTSGTFGQSVNVIAQLTLTAGGAAVAGKPVLIQIGGAAAIGMTGGDGKVTLPISLNTTPGPTSISTSFGGDATHLSSDAQGAFTIGKASTTLTPLTAFVTEEGEQRGVLTTLRATLGTKAQPLQNRTVTVTVAGPVTKTLSLITDYLGQVRLPLDLPTGTYTIGVTFAGDETYLPTSASGTSKVVTFAFQAPIDPAPTVNTAKAGSTVPVKFTIGGSFGLGILAGTPQTVKYNCETGVPTDEVEQTSTANSGLTFTNGVYQYNWKTAKSQTGCFRFELRLADGSLHVALIRLR